MSFHFVKALFIISKCQMHFQTELGFSFSSPCSDRLCGLPSRLRGALSPAGKQAGEWS